MNDLNNKYIQSSNQPKYKDEVVRIDVWESRVDKNKATSKLEKEAAENTINTYIKSNNKKMNVNDKIYADRYDEYGFLIEEGE